MASVEHRPALGSSQQHNTQASNRRRLQQKVSDKLLAQRTTPVRISKPLLGILDKLVPTKRGQKNGLTKGDLQIVALMGEAGYEVDTKAWTLVIALECHDHQNLRDNNCTNRDLPSPWTDLHAHECRLTLEMLPALLFGIELCVPRLEETLGLRSIMVPWILLHQILHRQCMATHLKRVYHLKQLLLLASQLRHLHQAEKTRWVEYRIPRDPCRFELNVSLQ